MKLIALLLSSVVLSPVAGSAALIYGLTSTNGLISFDSSSPGTVTTIGTISQAGIMDIDFYPVNGVLYGSTSTGGLYRINTATGAASLAASPSLVIASLTEIDFNPSADRLRIFAANDQNYRMAPDVFTNNAAAPGITLLDGTFSDTGVNLVGSAYSNNIDGTATTTLYSIDSVSSRLYEHSVGPAFNTVTPRAAMLGFTASLNVGFDIGQDGIAYLSNNNDFYTLDLTSGVATSAGTVGGSGLVSLAAVAVPEASTVSVLLLTGLAALRRRRA